MESPIGLEILIAPFAVFPIAGDLVNDFTNDMPVQGLAPLSLLQATEKKTIVGIRNFKYCLIVATNLTNKLLQP
jgi:hypothetical protein